MATAQEITSEIARLTERLRIARNGLKDLNPNYQSNQAILARYRDEVATIPGQILALQAELKSILTPASSGTIVTNANQARDENANPSSPSPPAQVITPDGRIVQDVSQATAGTNAVPTPTQQNNPTTGTDGAVRLISQTQAINNQESQLITAPTNTQASVRAIDNAIAAVGSPGVGAGADGGNVVVGQSTSPFPQYRPRTQSYVYQAISVISTFKQGRFEQTLHGILFNQSTANTTQVSTQQQRQETVKSAFDGIPAGVTKTNIIRKPTVGDLPAQQQAAIATGTDPNTVNDQGMAFGGGGL